MGDAGPMDDTTRDEAVAGSSAPARSVEEYRDSNRESLDRDALAQVAAYGAQFRRPPPDDLAGLQVWVFDATVRDDCDLPAAVPTADLDAHAVGPGFARLTSSGPRQTAATQTMVILHGALANGATVAVQVTGYRPCLRVLTRRNVSAQNVRDDVLEACPALSPADVSIRTDVVHRSYGWEPSEANPREVMRHRCVFITLPLIRHFWTVARALPASRYEVIERKVDDVLRFFDATNIRPGEWIQIDLPRRERSMRLTNAELEVHAPVGALKTVACDAVPPVLQASFDGEMLPMARNNALPQSDDVRDMVTQLSVTFNRHNGTEQDERNLVLHLCASQPPTNPHTTYVAFKTELGLCNALRDVLVASRTVVITGYNILNWDFPYLGTRVAMLMSMRFWHFGAFVTEPAELVKREIASAALGSMETHTVKASGLLVVDMMEEIQRRYSLESYKLAVVSKKFLQPGPSVQLVARRADGGWDVESVGDDLDEANAFLLDHHLPSFFPAPARARASDVVGTFSCAPLGVVVLILIAPRTERETTGYRLFVAPSPGVEFAQRALAEAWALREGTDDAGNVSAFFKTEEWTLLFRKGTGWMLNDAACANAGARAGEERRLTLRYLDGAVEDLTLNRPIVAMDDKPSTFRVTLPAAEERPPPSGEFASGDLACLVHEHGRLVLQRSHHKVNLPYDRMFDIMRAALRGDGDMTEVNAYADVDAQLPLRLFARLLVLVSLTEDARITACRISEQLTRGQGIKIFSALIWFLHRQTPVAYVYTAPPKVEHDQLQGATVLAPKRGFYKDPIITLDFASLYPSIMMSYNLCFSTLDRNGRAKARGVEHVECRISDQITDTFVTKEVCQGILPKLLEEVLQRRKLAKKMKAQCDDPIMKSILDCRQLKLKVLANTCYGVSGATNGPLSCQEIARCTTHYGRELIEATKKMVLEHPKATDCDVIYGDSVAAETPIVLRYRRDGRVRIVAFDALALELEWTTGADGKQSAFVDADVWSDDGWTALAVVIRHRVEDRAMVRVATNTGSVVVTKDHSLLLDAPRVALRPTACVVDATVLCSHGLDDATKGGGPPEATGALAANKARLLGLFLARGSCRPADGGRPDQWYITWERGAHPASIAKYRATAEACFPRCQFPLFEGIGARGGHHLLARSASPSRLAELCRAFALDGFDALGRPIVPEHVFTASVGAREAFVAGVCDGLALRDESKAGVTTVRVEHAVTAHGLFVLLRTLRWTVTVVPEACGALKLRFTRGVLREPAGLVKSVTECAAVPTQWVYDVSTSNGHFGAGVGDLVVHNTDSVMVRARGRSVQEAWDLGVELGEDITERFPGKIELECEQIKCPSVFGEQKKVYMAATWEPDKNDVLRRSPVLLAKGSEMARRDHPPFVRDSLRRASNALIFEGCTLESASDVRASAFSDSLGCCLESARVDCLRLVENLVPLEQCTLSKTLKPIMDYASVLQPHVQVALRAPGEVIGRYWKPWPPTAQPLPEARGFKRLANAGLANALLEGRLQFTDDELRAWGVPALSTLAMYVEVDRGTHAAAAYAYFIPNPQNWPTNSRQAFFYRQPALTELKSNGELKDLKISELAEDPATAAERGVVPWRLKLMQAFERGLMRPLTGAFDDPDLVLARSLFDTASTRLTHQLSGQRTLTSMFSKKEDTTVLDVPIGSGGVLPELEDEDGTDGSAASSSRDASSSAPLQFAPIASRAPPRGKRVGKGTGAAPNQKKKRP